ncbi:MAG: ABC transporter permease [Patescibacteria group bacterium]|nr:ABC transporter permease [Patescibacteria group bacterium]MDD4610833.1 ABC transporter permease [Patescibacteria group bacterium]
MNIITSFQMAFRSMRSNLVRTGLTVLGIVIGIAAVIIVFSAGEGIRGLILGQIESFGTDIIETEVKVPTGNKTTSNADASGAMTQAQGAQITTLTLDDMEEINKLSNVKDSYAGVMSQEQVSYGNELRKAFLMGTNASYIDIDKSEIEYGRFFTDAEDKSLSQVVVLGSKMKEKLFGDSDPIGQSIKIRKSKFRVIGVMKERGAVMVMNFDDYVYVPVRTLQKRLTGTDYVLYLIHQVNDLSRSENTAEEIRALLRERHDIISSDPKDFSKDDFRVTTMAEMLSMLDTITNALTILLLAIVAISLIVGGVGIMNIMYVVVSERTAEIGLRKAVGAKYNDIMLQFLIESILVTLIGGVIGIVAGVAIAILISWGANAYGLDWRFGIPLKAYIVALVFSIIFGIFFGLYPARKAAKLDPITALRNE